MNFIYQEFITNLSICDNLIQLFKDNSSHWIEGKCSNRVNLDTKKSTEHQKLYVIQ